jgi:3-oxoacyl-[acyl-carrier-protein] synthase III
LKPGALLQRVFQMNALTRKQSVDRSKIHLGSAAEVKSWAHRLKISPRELRSVVDKVGNSAAAVRKELAMEAANGVSQR